MSMADRGESAAPIHLFGDLFSRFCGYPGIVPQKVSKIDLFVPKKEDFFVVSWIKNGQGRPLAMRRSALWRLGG
jgi:hypothetical protein